MSQTNKIVEYFGIDTRNANIETLKQYQTKQICPYTNKRCLKSYKDPYLGVCSLAIQDKNTIICPNRFLASNIIFETIINDFRLDDRYELIKEKKVGNSFFDFVLLKRSYLPSYIAIEIQALDTCGSLKDEVVKMLKLPSSNKAKPLQVNWKMTCKTFLFQMIEKANITIKNDHQKLVAVIEKPLLDYMIKHYHFIKKGFLMSDDIFFYIYQYQIDGLMIQDKISFSYNEFLTFMLNNHSKGSLLSNFSNERLISMINSLCEDEE